MRGIDEASTSPVDRRRMMYDRVSESVRQIKAEHTNKMQSRLDTFVRPMIQPLLVMSIPTPTLIQPKTAENG